MSINSTLPVTLDDHLALLGRVSANRVWLTPSPGQATMDDLMVAHQHGSLCELVDGTLVEKAVGYEQSVVAATILRIVGWYVSKKSLGLVSGADGFFQLLSSTRGPDVAFVARDRLPQGRMPSQAYPQIAPNLVVEVLSPANTIAEMARKRMEYFHAGVDVVWMVDCLNRSVAVYTSPTAVQVLGETEAIDGGVALPEFTARVKDFFADLDIGQEIAEA